MQRRICGIYKITNTVNGKVYIGQSINVKQRWYGHICDLRHGRHRNVHLQNAWNYYGDVFKFEVIEECCKEDLNEREVYYIRRYNSYDREFGYNQTAGGSGTVVINEVLQFDVFGNLIKEFRNGCVASYETGINVGTIYGCCTRKLKKAENYIFIYKSEYEKNPHCINWYLESNRNTPVEQYDLFGNLVRVWSSCAEVVKETGANPIECLLHIKKTCHGYIWKRINDTSIEITEEYCKQIRDSSGKLMRKKIYQYDMDGNLIRIYNSFREAYDNHFCAKMIKQCAEHIRDSYKGYKWSYKELEVA